MSTTKTLRTQLIAAIAMILVACIAIGSSTYAWFAMNTVVTADGLSVEVKSNDTFLLISQAKTTATEIQTEATADATNHGTKTTFTISDDKVFPSKPWAATDATKYTHAAASNPNAVTTQAYAAVPGNWFTANSADPATSDTSIVSDSDSVLTADNFNDYVIKKTVYLTLAKGSGAAHNLTVKPTITAKTGSATNIDAVKVLVVTNADNIQTLSKDDATAKSLYAVADTELSDSTVVTVDIYIYYDGTVSTVYTNNIANLAGATISLDFAVEPKTTT